MLDDFCSGRKPSPMENDELIRESARRGGRDANRGIGHSIFWPLAMTIVNSSAADGFIQRLPKDLRFYLVHGSDEGLTHERSKAIVGKVLERRHGSFENRATRRGHDRARSRRSRRRGLCDPDVRRTARDLDRRAGTRSHAGAGAVVSSPPSDCAIVVKAAQLKRGAPLRSAFEKAANAASVECYSDESKALHQLIDAEAAEAGLAIAPDARAALLDLLGADRQTTRGEIAKLILYARGRRGLRSRTSRRSFRTRRRRPRRTRRSGAARRSASARRRRRPAISARAATGTS